MCPVANGLYYEAVNFIVGTPWLYSDTIPTTPLHQSLHGSRMAGHSRSFSHVRDCMLPHMHIAIRIHI